MRSRGTAGFTLLELITVVIILAMLSAAVIPMFGESLHSMRIETSIDDVVAALKSSHERAVVEMDEFRFYLDDETNEYWVERLVRLDDDHEKVFQPVAETYGRPTVLNRDLAFAKPKARRDKGRDAYYVAFYPSGAADEATVQIDHDDENRKIRIETEGRLGQFSISGRDNRSVWK